MSRSLILALLALLFALAPVASAQTVAWNAPGGGTFSTGGNWLGGIVPGSGSIASFGLANTYTVTFANSPTNAALSMSAGTVTFIQSGTQTYNVSGAVTITGGTQTISGLTLDTAGGLIMQGNSRMLLAGGGHVLASSLLVGNGSNATFTVNGSGSRFVADSAAANSFVGRSGGSGYMEFTNLASGSFAGDLGIAESANANSVGTLSVSGGSGVYVAGNVNVGASGVTGQRGFLGIGMGGGTYFIQSGSMTIGAAANSAGTVSVDGIFSGGTGLLTINPTGTLLIHSDAQNEGSVLFNGGFASMSSLADWDIAGTLNVGSGLLVIEDGSLTAHTLMGLQNVDLDVSSLHRATITIDGGALSTTSGIFQLHSSSVGGGSVTLRLTNGATFNLSNALAVGGNSGGVLEVLSGSSVSASAIFASTNANSDSSILVDGVGSSASIGLLYLGVGSAPPIPRIIARVQNGAAMTLNANATSTIGPWGELQVLSGATLMLGNSASLSGQSITGQTGVLRLDGGILNLNTAAQLVNYTKTPSADDGGSFAFNSGTIILRSASTFDVLAMDALLGPSRTLGFGKTIQELSTATFTSPMTLDGGVLSAGSLVNGNQLQMLRGTLNLTSGSLTIGAAGPFGASLSLPSSMTVAAPGVNVTASSLLHLNSARVVATGSIVNGGEIALTGGIAELSAATFNNNGLISGDGRINARLINSSAGTIRAGSDDHLRFAGASNSNSGTINLLGGIVEFTNASLTNGTTGRIIGRGSLLAPLGITNNATMTFSGGFSDVQGSVVNSATARVTVTGGSQTTFYNDVTNNAGSQFKVSDASIAAFLGTVSGLAAFTGNGTTIFEGAASGAALGAGATVVEDSGSLQATSIRQNLLNIRGLARIAPNGTTTGTSNLKTLQIDGSPGAWTGTMDLTNNALIIDHDGASPLSDVRDQIRTARGNGTWNGEGITSSLANSTRFALGYGENSLLDFDTFGGLSVDQTSVLVKYTYYGDSDLDGDADIEDLYALATHYNTTGGGVWTDGDFNYDGNVNVADLTLLAINWQAGVGSPIPGPDLALALTSLGLPLLAVPEPTSGVLALLCGTLLLRRYRRRVDFD